MSMTNHRRITAAHLPRQRGFVLIMALIVLVLMTIMGVTLMNATSVEARMAGNMQETARALGAAESAYEQYHNDPVSRSGLTVVGASTADKSYSFYNNESGVINNTYVERSEIPPRRSYDGAQSNPNFDTAHFRFNSTGTTVLDGQAVVQAGASRIIPGSN